MRPWLTRAAGRKPAAFETHAHDRRRDSQVQSVVQEQLWKPQKMLVSEDINKIETQVLAIIVEKETYSKLSVFKNHLGREV